MLAPKLINKGYMMIAFKDYMPMPKPVKQMETQYVTTKFLEKLKEAKAGTVKANKAK
jgi:hypothetical protein